MASRATGLLALSVVAIDCERGDTFRGQTRSRFRTTLPSAGRGDKRCHEQPRLHSPVTDVRSVRRPREDAQRSFVKRRSAAPSSSLSPAMVN